MSLFSKIVGLVASSTTQVGNTDPVCPHCSERLEKMPSRKKKCPSCKEDIYVRTRPGDKKRILIRADQIEAVEEQRAIVNGTHPQFLAAQKERNALKRKLQRSLGRVPTEHEVEWALLGEAAADHVRQKNWGLYRNARFDMSELLSKQGQHERALALLLEVCYVDLNGPRNCGGDGEFDLSDAFPPFDLEMSDLAGGVIARVSQAMQRTGLDLRGVESQFAKVATRLAQSIPLPLTPKKAWRKLKRELRAG